MKPNYSTNDPKGWCGNCERGAALGRPFLKSNSDWDGKVFLSEIRLDRGGYDINGTYFGHSQRLYWVAAVGEFGELLIDYTLRARDRNDAKEKVLEDYPDVKFYR